ncbi:hypothetical protein Tco_1420696 [Tanacetum coccineum]
MQGPTPLNSATRSYMTPGGSFTYNPYWNGMHPRMTAYMHPYYIFAYCNGQFGVPGMKPSKTGPHREESKASKSESRLKHGLKRGVQRRYEFWKSKTFIQKKMEDERVAAEAQRVADQLALHKTLNDSSEMLLQKAFKIGAVRQYSNAG